MDELWTVALTRLIKSQKKKKVSGFEADLTTLLEPEHLFAAVIHQSILCFGGLSAETVKGMSNQERKEFLLASGLVSHFFKRRPVNKIGNHGGSWKSKRFIVESYFRRDAENPKGLSLKVTSEEMLEIQKVYRWKLTSGETQAGVDNLVLVQHNWFHQLSLRDQPSSALLLYRLPQTLIPWSSVYYSIECSPQASCDVA